MKRLSFIIAFIIVLTSGWLLSSHTKAIHPTNTESITTEIVVIPKDQTFVKVLDIDVNKHTNYQNIDFEFVYTSFIFEISRSADFVSTIYYTNEDESFKLDSIPQTDQPGNERRSPFIIPKTPQQYFNFYSGNLEGKVRLYLFYAPPISVKNKTILGKKAKSLCDKPQLITGKVWRDGLPQPKGVREKHDVDHCVIHHAASSNTNHDYVNVVRNIYLLHTQTNGWDDIGYNFVVAQDGSIFEGRDNQNIDSTDNIKGAHFCGKNTNTMGICVLGNYQEIAPTQASVDALTHLLTWKCYKDNINALGSSPHPTSSSASLEHVAGHQDGCATACPGDSLYRLLPDLRLNVDSIMATCGNVNILNNSSPKQLLTWYQNEGSRNITVDISNTESGNTLKVIGSNGQIIWKRLLKDHQGKIEINGLSSGIYYLSLEKEGRKITTQPILVR